MRNVVQQARLRIYGLLQSLGHGIEIAHQSGKFVPAPQSAATARSGGEIAFRQTTRSLSQTPDRRGEIKSQQVANDS